MWKRHNGFKVPCINHRYLRKEVSNNTFLRTHFKDWKSLIFHLFTNKLCWKMSAKNKMTGWKAVPARVEDCYKLYGPLAKVSMCYIIYTNAVYIHLHIFNTGTQINSGFGQDLNVFFVTAVHELIRFYKKHVNCEHNQLICAKNAFSSRQMHCSSCWLS